MMLHQGPIPRINGSSSDPKTLGSGASRNGKNVSYTDSNNCNPNGNSHGNNGDATLNSNSKINGLSTSENALIQKRRHGDYMTALAIMRPTVLDYDVHSCSSYSASYLPENIKVNNPQDQSSRWSSGSNNQMQYIMIKLKRMAIANTITFGKYHKVHVCNLKEFKVFGGLTSSNMTELLHTGLKNDNEQETFLLKHKTQSVVFPCQYIKIVPLMAWGANFNFSVWYVNLKGIQDTELVQDTYFRYINFRETESIRLCLKHFRQRNLLEAFQALQGRTQIQLEDSLLTQLHHALVTKGNFKLAEELMMQAADRGLLNEYIEGYDYKPIWKRLSSGSTAAPGGTRHASGSASASVDHAPKCRGGHQMCIDTQGGFVYLMGGWDGNMDLADFWAFHIPSQAWILISADTSVQGGPSARSCHKICYSAQHGAIFLLGKYVDPDNRNKVDLSSDFWRFDIDPHCPPHGRWTKICSNTAALNGPELIYDHQMCLDPLSQTLYVFGGRVVQMDKNMHQYSGLYSYHIPTETWVLLRGDGIPSPPQDGNTVLRSRIGHSMLYDELLRGLVIFAGQMNKDYLSDFYVYDILANRVIEVCKDYNKQGGPEAGFTQRATISSRGREIYVLSGLVKDKALGAETVKNSFWVFKLPGQSQISAIKDVHRALEKAASEGTLESLSNIIPTEEEDGQQEKGIHQDHDMDTNMDIAKPSRSPPGESSGSAANNRTPHHAPAPPAMSNQTASSPRSARSQGQQQSPSTQSTHQQPRGPNAIMAGPGASRFGAPNVIPFSPSGPPQQESTMLPPPPPASFNPHAAPQTEQGRQQQRQNGRHHPQQPLQGHSQYTQQQLEQMYRQQQQIHLQQHHQQQQQWQQQQYSNRHSLPQPRPNSGGPTSLAYVLSDSGSWQKIFQNSNLELGQPSEPEPVPRYAHQLVYDDVNEVQYLFGGNPGEVGNMSKRLDDFWELRLFKPKAEQIVRKAKYMLRSQQFKEICQRPEGISMETTGPHAPTSIASVLASGPCSSAPSLSSSAGTLSTNFRGYQPVDGSSSRGPTTAVGSSISTPAFAVEVTTPTPVAIPTAASLMAGASVSTTSSSFGSTSLSTPSPFALLHQTANLSESSPTLPESHSRKVSTGGGSSNSGGYQPNSSLASTTSATKRPLSSSSLFSASKLACSPSAINASTSSISAGKASTATHSQKSRDRHQSQKLSNEERARLALKFLQTELSSVVDESNKVEREEFKALIRGMLLGGTYSVTASSSPLLRQHAPYFSTLISSFPLDSARAAAGTGSFIGESGSKSKRNMAQFSSPSSPTLPRQQRQRQLMAIMQQQQYQQQQQQTRLAGSNAVATGPSIINNGVYGNCFSYHTLRSNNYQPDLSALVNSRRPSVMALSHHHQMAATGSSTNGPQPLAVVSGSNGLRLDHHRGDRMSWGSNSRNSDVVDQDREIRQIRHPRNRRTAAVSVNAPTSSSTTRTSAAHNTLPTDSTPVTTATPSGTTGIAPSMPSQPLIPGGSPATGRGGASETTLTPMLNTTSLESAPSSSSAGSTSHLMTRTRIETVMEDEDLEMLESSAEGGSNSSGSRTETEGDTGTTTATGATSPTTAMLLLSSTAINLHPNDSRRTSLVDPSGGVVNALLQQGILDHDGNHGSGSATSGPNSSSGGSLTAENTRLHNQLLAHRQLQWQHQQQNQQLLQLRQHQEQVHQQLLSQMEESTVRGQERERGEMAVTVLDPRSGSGSNGGGSGSSSIPLTESSAAAAVAAAVSAAGLSSLNSGSSLASSVTTTTPLEYSTSTSGSSQRMSDADGTNAMHPLDQDFDKNGGSGGDNEDEEEDEDSSLSPNSQREQDEDYEDGEGEGDEDEDEDDEAFLARQLMDRQLYQERTNLYEQLLEFFGDHVKQPKGDLIDLVKVG